LLVVFRVRDGRLLRTGADDDVHCAARLYLRAGGWMLLYDVAFGHPVVRDLHSAAELETRLLEDLPYRTQGLAVDTGNLYAPGALTNRDRDCRAHLGGIVRTATGFLPDHEVLVFGGAPGGLDLDLETRLPEDSLCLHARFSPNVGHVRDPGANHV